MSDATRSAQNLPSPSPATAPAAAPAATPLPTAICQRARPTDLAPASQSESSASPRSALGPRGEAPPVARAQARLEGLIPAWLRERMMRLAQDLAVEAPTADAATQERPAPSALSEASAHQQQRCHELLRRMPLGHQVLHHRRDRREHHRRLRVIAGRTRAAPAEMRWREHRAHAQWSAELLAATARGWAQLGIARAQLHQPGFGTLAGYLGPMVPTAAGTMLGSSYGTQQGCSEAVVDCLEQAYLALTPQRAVRMPWMHLVGAYGQAVGDGQMAHDAMSVMHGIALDPGRHLWTLFGHGSHWHLVVSRVANDGRSYVCPRLALALRTTVDVLDAESGRQTGYDAPGSRFSTIAAAVRDDRFEAMLMGRDQQGRSTSEALPLQGPAWARRVAPLGAYPQRLTGLLVIPKPSYRSCDAIVRHCIDT